jgi:hypothetical protein
MKKAIDERIKQEKRDKATKALSIVKEDE